MTSSIGWPDGESGYFRSVPADPHRTGTITATVANVTVTPEGIREVNWTADFVFDVQSAFSNRDYAENNDSWSWTSNAMPVWSK